MMPWDGTGTIGTYVLVPTVVSFRGLYCCTVSLMHVPYIQCSAVCFVHGFFKSSLGLLVRTVQLYSRRALLPTLPTGWYMYMHSTLG